MAVERTRLAAERTFSAWIRTGLAGVGGGLAIIHLLVFENEMHRMAAKMMGQLLLLWGGLLFLYALYGYDRVVRHLGKAIIGSSRMWIMALMSLAMFFSAVVFFVFSFKF